MSATLLNNGAAFPSLTINAQTGTTYTFVLTDSYNTLVTASNASAITVTVPPNSSVAYPVGAILQLAQGGAGQVTIAAGSGVTITSTGAAPAAPKTRVQYSACSAIQTSANNWLVVGDIA